MNRFKFVIICGSVQQADSCQYHAAHEDALVTALMWGLESMIWSLFSAEGAPCRLGQVLGSSFPHCEARTMTALPRSRDAFLYRSVSVFNTSNTNVGQVFLRSSAFQTELWGSLHEGQKPSVCQLERLMNILRLNVLNPAVRENGVACPCSSPWRCIRRMLCDLTPCSAEVQERGTGHTQGHREHQWPHPAPSLAE